MNSVLPATTPAMTSACPFRYLVALSITTSMPKSAGLSAQQPHQSTHSLTDRPQPNNCTVLCKHIASAQIPQSNRQSGRCLPYDSRAGKRVVDDAGKIPLLTEGSHSRNICYLQQRVADSFYVENLWTAQINATQAKQGARQMVSNEANKK